MKLHSALCILHFSCKAPGGGAGDGNVLVGADEGFAALEADQSAALGAGGEEAPVGSVDEAAEGLTHIALVNL